MSSNMYIPPQMRKSEDINGKPRELYQSHNAAVCNDITKKNMIIGEHTPFQGDIGEHTPFQGLMNQSIYDKKSKNISDKRKSVFQTSILIEKNIGGNIFEKRKKNNYNLIDSYDDSSFSSDEENVDNLNQSKNDFQLEISDTHRQINSKSNFPGWDTEDRLGW